MVALVNTNYYIYYDTENFFKHCQKVERCLTLANLNYIVNYNASLMPPSKIQRKCFLSYKTTCFIRPGCCLFCDTVDSRYSFCADVVIMKALWRLQCHVASLPHISVWILWTQIYCTASAFLVFKIHFLTLNRFADFKQTGILLLIHVQSWLQSLSFQGSKAWTSH